MHDRPALFEGTIERGTGHVEGHEVDDRVVCDIEGALARGQTQDVVAARSEGRRADDGELRVGRDEVLDEEGHVGPRFGQSQALREFRGRVLEEFSALLAFEVAHPRLERRRRLAFVVEGHARLRTPGAHAIGVREDVEGGDGTLACDRKFVLDGEGVAASCARGWAAADGLLEEGALPFFVITFEDRQRRQEHKSARVCGGRRAEGAEGLEGLIEGQFGRGDEREVGLVGDLKIGRLQEVEVRAGTEVYCACHEHLLSSKLSRGPQSLSRLECPMRTIVLVLSVGLLACAARETPKPKASGQTHARLETERGPLAFLRYVPHNYETRDDWPVVIFLHGSGEREGPLDVVATWGPPRFAARGDDLPYVLISPQCPPGGDWTDEVRLEQLDELLAHVLTSERVDKARVIVTGVSMGGYGTWSWAARSPEKFAAAVPVCGGGEVSDAARLKDVPIWAFHGTEDGAVPFEDGQKMVEAARAVGNPEVRFTTLEHVGHNVWSSAYATPLLTQWMLKQINPRR